MKLQTVNFNIGFLDAFFPATSISDHRQSEMPVASQDFPHPPALPVGAYFYTDFIDS